MSTSLYFVESESDIDEVYVYVSSTDYVDSWFFANDIIEITLNAAISAGETITVEIYPV